MSYYIIKNLNINKKDGTITCKVADSNALSMAYEDYSIKGKSFHEKYSNLIYNIIAGNYHPDCLSKYYDLCNSWNEPALKNFIGDCQILGIESTYDKYKNVIEDIIHKRKPQILKSEIELHYNIEYGNNINYDTLNNKVDHLDKFMKGIRDNLKLSSIDRLKLYQEFTKVNNISFPLVTLIGYENSTKIFLYPHINRNDFLTYKITVENMETGTLKSFEIEDDGLIWITNYSESEMAFKMQSYERKFIIFQKISKILNKSITHKNPKNLTLKLDKLNIRSDEVRILLDMLKEDYSIQNFEYNKKTNEIIVKFELEKDNDALDILDEMYG